VPSGRRAPVPVLAIAAILGPVFGWLQFCIVALIQAAQRGTLDESMENWPGLFLFLPVSLLFGILPGVAAGSIYLLLDRWLSAHVHQGAALSLLAAAVSGAMGGSLLLIFDDEWISLEFAPLFGAVSGFLCALCFLNRIAARSG
jgi:hypothetical protein